MLLRIVLTLGFALFTSVPAWACSCVGISDKSVGEHIGSDTVFVGTPISTRYEPRSGSFGNTVITTFEVDRMFRGNPEKRKIEIGHRQDGAACGVWFMLGERQLVNAYDTDDGLSTGLCSNPLPDMVVVNYFEKHEDPQIMSYHACEKQGLLKESDDTKDQYFSIASNPCRIYNDSARRLSWKAWKNWLKDQNFKTP